MRFPLRVKISTPNVFLSDHTCRSLVRVLLSFCHHRGLVRSEPTALCTTTTFSPTFFRTGTVRNKPRCLPPRVFQEAQLSQWRSMLTNVSPTFLEHVRTASTHQLLPTATPFFPYGDVFNTSFPFQWMSRSRFLSYPPRFFFKFSFFGSFPEPARCPRYFHDCPSPPLVVAGHFYGFGPLLFTPQFPVSTPLL